jgi:hypothetical protein
MAWLPRTNKDCTDVDDEAGVGLISIKSESVATDRTRWKQSQISKSALSVALILSNVAWDGICSMLWREPSRSRIPARASHNQFEADFGTLNLHD